MKKGVILLIFVGMILSACHSAELSFSKVENVPGKIAAHIDSNVKLQIIMEETKGEYLIFHSNRAIEAEIDTTDHTIDVILNEINSSDDTIKQHVYYLTKDATQDTIRVLVNGEEQVIDNITGI